MAGECTALLSPHTSSASPASASPVLTFSGPGARFTVRVPFQHGPGAATTGEKAAMDFAKTEREANELLAKQLKESRRALRVQCLVRLVLRTE